MLVISEPGDIFSHCDSFLFILSLLHYYNKHENRFFLCKEFLLFILTTGGRFHYGFFLFILRQCFTFNYYNNAETSSPPLQPSHVLLWQSCEHSLTMTFVFFTFQFESNLTSNLLELCSQMVLEITLNFYILVKYLSNRLFLYMWISFFLFQNADDKVREQEQGKFSFSHVHVHEFLPLNLY